MLAVAAWVLIAGQRAAEPVEPGRVVTSQAAGDIAPPPRVPSLRRRVALGVRAQPQVEQPASQSGQTTPATQPAVVVSDVHWPTEDSPHWRHLALAQATLEEEPCNELALRDAARAAGGLERWREAASLLERLQRLRPDDPEVCFELAAMLLRLRRFSAAAAVLEPLVADHPDHARAWFNLAIAHQAQGHLAAARRAWSRVIELSPSAEARARRAEVLLDLREWAEAGADLEIVAEQQPDAVDVVLNLALALEQLGRAGDARARLAEFAGRHPHNPAVLNRLGELAWKACCAGPSIRSPACSQAAEWCRRSLAVDANQPAVRALLDEIIARESEE